MASQQDLDRAKGIGAGGGTVDTNGMTSTDRQQIDKAVNDGKASSGR